VGIWDGESFVFSTSTSKSRWSGWWDTAAALWRYGPVSPYRQRGAVRGLLTRFGRLYDPTWLANRGPLDSIEAFSETVELGKDMTTVTGKEWAAGTVGVSERWWSEIMEASTRVNVSCSP
jgi:prenylcysteine oxidase/farnesylcysteine lyase